VLSSANTVLLGAGAKFSADALNNNFDVLGMLFNLLNKLLFY
jgi:hypothetical protein